MVRGIYKHVYVQYTDTEFCQKLRFKKPGLVFNHAVHLNSKLNIWWALNKPISCIWNLRRSNRVWPRSCWELNKTKPVLSQRFLKAAQVMQRNRSDLHFRSITVSIWRPGMRAHAHHPSSWEAEEGAAARPACLFSVWVPGLLGLHKETLSWKTRTKRNSFLKNF